jgi:hypothetical protein
VNETLLEEAQLDQHTDRQNGAATAFQKTASIADLERESLEKLAPRPNSLADTGLEQTFLSDLAAKHLLDGGVLTLGALSERMALAGPIVRQLLEFMRAEARIEVRGLAKDGSAANLRYALTDRGRAGALDAMRRSGYVGPAPVPLDDYLRVVKAQTVHGRDVRSADMDAAFENVVLRQEIRDQLGPALNSGRAIFIYGHAGTGKTFITQQLVKLFPDVTLLPYAIAIDEIVVEVYDPILHRPVNMGYASPNIMLERGHDPRFVCCERPRIIAGGELTADMLEIRYDASTKRYQAPMQLKANNGVFIIDDMGRQRVAPETVFNRWIVPMEEKVDYLTLGSGRHFTVPFDVILLFSTNLHPTDIADEAFLRRIGYKIEFPFLRAHEYKRIWDDFCEAAAITCDDDVLEYTLKALHAVHAVPLLPCHPRDLLSIAAERSTYDGNGRHVSKDSMHQAWHNYFVLSKPGNFTRPTPSKDGGSKS